MIILICGFDWFVVLMLFSFDVGYFWRFECWKFCFRLFCWVWCWFDLGVCLLGLCFVGIVVYVWNLFGCYCGWWVLFRFGFFGSCGTAVYLCFCVGWLCWKICFSGSIVCIVGVSCVGLGVVLGWWVCFLIGCLLWLGSLLVVGWWLTWLLVILIVDLVLCIWFCLFVVGCWLGLRFKVCWFMLWICCCLW